MSQISPPLRILLIGCVVFMAAWMTVLKPGGEETSVPAAPAATAPRPVEAGGSAAQTGPGRAVEAANNAAETQAAANAAHGSDAPGTTSSAPATTASGAAKAPAAGAAPEADVSEAGLPKRVARAVADNKILVLLFWNPKAADDRAVRREMKSVGSRHRKDVVVHVANVKQISRFAPITRGANVDQSPSVVVVGRDRQVTLLEGYSDRQAIQQVVYDAMRSKSK